ncbi:membrane protein insertase YidC [bacterium]|nr:membrane protein insertase YidC [bacterium]
MDKRTALATALIFVVWIVYMLWFAPKPQPRPATVNAPADTTQVIKSDTAARVATEPGALSDLSAPDVEPVDETPVDTVVVSGELYEYRFITRGAVLVKAGLKHYPSFNGAAKNADSDKLPPVQLIPDESRFLSSRLIFGGSGKDVDLGARRFCADKLSLRLDKSNPQGTITFLDTLNGGATIRIVYTFHNDSYLIESAMYLPPQLSGASGNALEVTLGPTLLSNEKKPDADYASYKAIYYDNGSVVEKSIKDLSKSDWQPSGEHRILWGGLKSQYFITTFFVPDAPMDGMSASGNLEAKRIYFRGRFPIPAQAGTPVVYSIYAGPQAYDQITRLNYGLPKIFEYGWVIIQPFTKMILRIMLWMHTYVSNYALILVLFALLVKVVFYPLTIKSTKSQIEMQKIQPLMTEMRERFKDDPRKQQEEMLKLYREHKVNPLGGCLPMVIQMPVLFALFYVFQRTIELRGADAFLWIHDLSQPDPYYVMPVLMAVSMFVQQKLTPTQTDPKMKPMMYMMPIMMLIFFINFSSGLVLYYTIFNVIQMFQQMYIQKRYHAPLQAAAAAAGPVKAVAAPKQSGGRKKKS